MITLGLVLLRERVQRLGRFLMPRITLRLLIITTLVLPFVI